MIVDDFGLWTIIDYGIFCMITVCFHLDSDIISDSNKSHKPTGIRK